MTLDERTEQVQLKPGRTDRTGGDEIHAVLDCSKRGKKGNAGMNGLKAMSSGCTYIELSIEEELKRTLDCRGLWKIICNQKLNQLEGGGENRG